MTSPRWLPLCAFVLAFVPSLALAAEPSLVDWAKHRIQDGLLKPLAQRRGSSFSRVQPPPRAQRVRILKAFPITDRSGHKFVPFVVDGRFGSGEWQADISGCVYRATGKIFVKRGDEYRPAEFLLGKRVDPAPDVCEAAPGA